MAGKQKNILLVIPEMCVGGAQQSLANLSLELAKVYHVSIAIFSDYQLISYTLGGELLDLKVSSGKTWLRKGIALYQRVSRLKQLKAQLQIDVTISFLEGADYVNILSRRKDRILISIRGSKYHDRKISGLMGWLRLRVFMPMLYAKADGIICVSKALGIEMISKMGLPASKVQTIYNFLNLSQADKQNDLDLSFPFLLGVGRFHEQKNFKGMLTVFNEVRHSLPSLKLIIVGDGEQKEELISHALNLGMRIGAGGTARDVDVWLPGFCDPWSFYLQAKIVLLTSSWEGFPNVMLEAMAAGALVLAADCETGPREILADGYGGPVPYFSASGVLLPMVSGQGEASLWADAIKKLLSDPDLLEKYRSSGKARASEFSTTAAMNAWIGRIEGV